MFNVDGLVSIAETLAILSNPALSDAIRAGNDDVAAGHTECLSRDQALARIAKR